MAIEIEYRKCIQCKEHKLLSEFNGKWKVCKVCDKVRRKEKVQKCRNFILDYLQNHPCVDCGQSDPTVLIFDHLRDKRKSLSYFIRKGYSVKVLIEEIKKCEVRCANCHARKTAREQGWYKYDAGQD